VTAYRPQPARHWRSYGDDKLPAPAEALSEPFAAFPSWFMRIECDRCGKVPAVFGACRCVRSAGSGQQATW
jgi:hypothetical protein